MKITLLQENYDARTVVSEGVENTYNMWESSLN